MPSVLASLVYGGCGGICAAGGTLSHGDEEAGALGAGAAAAPEDAAVDCGGGAGVPPVMGFADPWAGRPQLEQ